MEQVGIGGIMQHTPRPVDPEQEGIRQTLLERITPLARQINCLDIERIAEICVTMVPKLVEMTFGSLYVLDETNQMLHLIRYSHPYPINRLVSLNQMPPSPMTLAVRSKELIIVGDLDRHQTPVIPRSQRVYADKYQTRNCVIVPLVCQERVVGAFNLADKQRDAFSREDVALIELFGQLAGASIGNIKLFERMQHQATTDGLTGFVNHRTFYDLLEKELWRSRRYGDRIALMMIDMDNFKTINDTYGHRAGDRVIQEISRRIKGCIRQIDIAARYGGDEFAVILPNTSKEEALFAAERMTRVIAERPVVWQGHEITLSISIGVAQYDANCNPEEVTRRSDQALYRAKESGKNTVCLFEA